MQNPLVQKIAHLKHQQVIKDRRFLDDEQLIRSEQIELLEAVFNAKVRDSEITELTLLSKSAYLADKQGTKITMQTVDDAASKLEQDCYLLMIRTAPVHLQATMASIIMASRTLRKSSISTIETYDRYKDICNNTTLKPLTMRAVGDLVSELAIYSFIRVKVISRGRYGRSRDIRLELPEKLEERIYEVIMLNFGLKI